jgi:hypothetical protein
MDSAGSEYSSVVRFYEYGDELSDSVEMVFLDQLKKYLLKVDSIPCSSLISVINYMKVMSLCLVNTSS